MSKEIGQEQNNSQQVNFNNGNLIEQKCNFLARQWMADQSVQPSVSVLIFNGLVTQVICQYLSRNGDRKCQFSGNAGKDCYYFPPKIEGGVQRTIHESNLTGDD
jgi:hypothetical protein